MAVQGLFTAGESLYSPIGDKQSAFSTPSLWDDVQICPCEPGHMLPNDQIIASAEQMLNFIHTNDSAGQPSALCHTYKVRRLCSHISVLHY